MMYSFDADIDRRNTDSSKWDDIPYSVKADDMLPMWTADMDFACPKAIMDAIQKRMEHPIFGYMKMPERYQKSIIQWHKTRLHQELSFEEIVPVASVLGGVSMAIQAFTEKGDSILISAPGYHAFENAVNHNERTLVPSPLKRSGDFWYMDFELMEKQMSEERVTMFILCSPHNPTGRIWSREELSQLIDLCFRYQVYLLSDEIHADMTLTHSFTPLFGTGNEKAREIGIALYAPTKTFNIAGLCTAYAIMKNKELRQRFQKALLASGLKVKNTLGIEAMIGGYENGGEWVDALQSYLLSNAEYAVDYIKKYIPAIHAYVPEATYFLWLDFRETGLSQDEIIDKIVNEAHIAVTRGDEFIEGGESFVRMVCACPRFRLEEAMLRLRKTFS